MSMLRLPRYILRRGVLIALGLLVVVLAVGPLDHAAAQADTRPKWVHDGTFTVLDLVQEYTVGVAVDVTLPAATGDGTLTYSLTPEQGATLPAGVTFNASTRKLTGVPTTAQALTGYSYKVTDGDGDTAKFDIAIVVLEAPPVQEQVLVSNIGKGSPQSFEHNQDRAQGFTTGSSGYIVTSVELPMGKDPGTAPTFTVAIHADSSGQPGSKLATLTAPQTLVEGINEFTHAGVELAPSTSYFVVIDVSAQGTRFATFVHATTSDEEDSTEGWTLGNDGHHRSFGSLDAYESSRQSLVLRINGAVTTPSVALVSNTDETAQDIRLFKDNAQGFTTGGGGYILTSVDLDMVREATGTAPTFTVAIHSDSNGQPGDSLATLTAPQTLATGLNRFTHTGLALASSTSYFVVIDVSATGTTGATIIRVTSSDDEDSTVGWTIGNDGHYRDHDSSGTYSTDTSSVVMRINGTLGNLSGLTVKPVAGKTTELAVSWTAQGGAEQYRVQHKTATSAYSSGTTVTTNSHTITGLTADTTYTVRVTAIDTDADPDADLASDQAVATTPDEMGAISVSAVAGSATELSPSWTDINGETGYLVQWKTGGQSYDAARSHTTAANVTSARIAGLSASTVYTVRVTARVSIDGQTADGDSAEGSGTTNAPTASPGVLVANTGNARRGYETLGGADAAQAFTTGGNATGYTLTSVEFILRGISENRGTNRSDGLEVFIAAERPLASRPGNSLALLTNPDTLSNGSNAFTHPGLHLEPDTTYYVVIDVVCSAYDFRSGVRLTLSHAETGAAGWSIGDGRYIQRYANNHRRHGGSWTAHPSSNVLFSVNGVANAQFAPRQHSLIDDVLRVLWTPSTDSGVTGYLVQWKTGAQSYSTLERSHTAGSDDASHEVWDLPLGEHTVRVTQQGGAGDGNAQEATVTLHGWPGVVYMDPVAGDARAADVQWETVSTAAGYVIEWKPVTFDTCAATSRATVAADNLTYRTYTDGYTGEDVRYPVYRATGLAPSTEYNARVTAYTAAGSASRPDGLSHSNYGATFGEITGLSVSPADGETTKLNVRWTAPALRSDGYTVRGYRVEWKTGSGEYPEANKATVSSGTTAYQITGLEAETAYTVKVTVLSNWLGNHEDGDSAEATGTTNAPNETGQGQSSPQQGESGPEGVGTAALAGLTVASVPGQPTQLAVSWDEVQGAARYDVRWKTGAGDYGDAQQSTTNSHTITGLSANTSYTVNVAALDGDNALLAEGTADGTTDQQQSDGTPAVSFVIYHDPDAGDAVVDRYNQGVKLLKDAGISYSEVKGDVQDDVDELAGVTGSVLPRFFLGDPTEEGWVSQPGENNGGLRWLRDKTSEIGDDKAGAPEDPAVLGGLTVHPVSGETTSLAVSWNAVTGADKYLVQWKTGADDYNSGDTVTTNSHTITGLAGSTVYTVQVTAIDTDADPEAELAAGEASGATLAAVGMVSVTAVTDSSDSLDVSWASVSGAVGYVVEYKTGDGSYTAVTRSDATATTERITGLEAETAYTVKVTARHTIGGSTVDGDSAEGSGTTNAAPAEEPPANTPASGAPTISGTAQVGETLTANTSGISDTDGLTNASFSYQWLADGSDISGATGSSYTPVAGDAGKAIKVTVSFTDDAGNAESLTSAATEAVVKAANTPATGSPTISGTAQVGETLTADTSGISDADGLSNASFSYQWLADGSDISDATGSTYSPVAGDAGKVIKVTVSFTDDAGNAETLTSAATAAVVATNTPASGAPTISGTAQVGETLTANTSGISDADGLANATYSYQWLADGSDISGATSSTYTLVVGDVGKAIKVTVSFTDGAGNAESVTSAATPAVAAEDPPEEEAAAVSFVIYHDPNAGDDAVDRYNQGVKLLKDAGLSYSEVIGDVQEDVDSLAGVTGSVLPRFFLGDPTDEDWVSETKVNNGGLRWLKEKVAELSGG